MAKTKTKEKLFKIKRNNCASKPTRRRRAIKYLGEELQDSTTHGLSYLLNTKLHYFERAFWIINCIGASVLVTFLLSAQYTRYTDTPIVMSVENDYFNWNVSYPAITLCPRNGNKTDKEALQIIAQEIQMKTMVDQFSVNDFLESIVSISLENMEEIDYEKLDSLQIGNPKDYANLAASVFKKFDLISLTTTTNSLISVEAALTEVGMCHVINSNVAPFDNPLKWNNNITTYSKNNVDLAFHDRDFFAQITKYSDIYKIYIHAPDDVILVTMSPYTHDTEGLLELGVKVRSFKISDELKGSSMKLRKCRHVHEPISSRYPVYSYSHCLLECRIQMILRLCGCVPHFYRPVEGEKICPLSRLKCVSKYRKQIISLTSNPALKLSLGLPLSHKDCGCISECDANIYQKEQENMSPSKVQAMRVIISSFPRVRVVRETIFNLYDILLRSGGVVNLCFGTSIISLIELAIIALKLLYYVIANKIHIF